MHIMVSYIRDTHPALRLLWIRQILPFVSHTGHFFIHLSQSAMLHVLHDSIGPVKHSLHSRHFGHRRMHPLQRHLSHRLQCDVYARQKRLLQNVSKHSWQVSEWFLWEISVLHLRHAGCRSWISKKYLFQSSCHSGDHADLGLAMCFSALLSESTILSRIGSKIFDETFAFVMSICSRDVGPWSDSSPLPVISKQPNPNRLISQPANLINDNTAPTSSSVNIPTRLFSRFAKSTFSHCFNSSTPLLANDRW